MEMARNKLSDSTYQNQCTKTKNGFNMSHPPDDNPKVPIYHDVQGRLPKNLILIIEKNFLRLKNAHILSHKRYDNFLVKVLAQVMIPIMNPCNYMKK